MSSSQSRRTTAGSTSGRFGSTTRTEGTELVAAFVQNERANSLTKGTKATIIGEGVDDSFDGTMPPEITVLQVLPASTGCE